MLQHVRAEQIRVAQVVEPAVERKEHQHEREVPPETLRGARLRNAFQPCPALVQRCQPHDADDRARMHGETARAQSRADVQQREPHGGHLPENLWKRKSNATIVDIAMMSGPVKSDLKILWSYLRCM